MSTIRQSIARLFHLSPGANESANAARELKMSALYERYSPIIYARCRRILRDPAVAEDATQEVFVRVLRHLESAPDDAAALAWISRISTNYCLNAKRDQSRREESVSEVPEESSDHPEGAFINRDLAERLLTRVPERLRAPATLYYVDGMEQQHIAELLGVSRRTVINRLGDFNARARKYLAREDILDA